MNVAGPIVPRRRWRVAYALALGFGVIPHPAFARPASECAASRIDSLICADPALAQLDDALKTLFDRIEGETRGVDAETGEPVDRFGADHARWRESVRDACPDAACLRQVYTARIAQVRRDWGDALGSAGTRQHYVNARFAFSVDLPAGLVAERSPDNGDGLAFHAPDGSFRVVVSGINNALDQSLRDYIANDRARCPRQPPDYLVERPDWIVFSCTAGGDILYQKTIRSGRGADTAFVSLRIRYAARAKDRWQEAVVTASKTLRLPAAGAQGE